MDEDSQEIGMMEKEALTNFEGLVEELKQFLGTQWATLVAVLQSGAPLDLLEAIYGSMHVCNESVQCVRTSYARVCIHVCMNMIGMHVCMCVRMCMNVCTCAFVHVCALYVCLVCIYLCICMYVCMHVLLLMQIYVGPYSRFSRSVIESGGTAIFLSKVHGQDFLNQRHRVLSYFLQQLTCPLHTWSSFKCTGFCKFVPMNAQKHPDSVKKQQLMGLRYIYIYIYLNTYVYIYIYTYLSIYASISVYIYLDSRIFKFVVLSDISNGGKDFVKLLGSFI